MPCFRWQVLFAIVEDKPLLIAVIKHVIPHREIVRVLKAPWLL